MTYSNDWRRRWAFVLLMAVAVLALAGWRGGDATGATAGASATKAVKIVSFAFQPKTLRVKRGTKVAFTNASNTTHTASGTAFDTRRIAPGKSATVQLGSKGTFAFHCKIHPFMKGTIVVE
ncbi:MAG TPA: cupredoxin domain-containing protein [Solirubrobacterales bacterium]|nr:cupredoxin domain-containing protein [Solirubrobacterales bacterium]